ncbi:MAG: hypothetical protein HZC50_08265, partial [Nitrospirae bacterium]|nr:hypothetical protein [Nitrospirota bacterium]
MAGGRSEMVTIGHAVIPTERPNHTRLVTGAGIVCALLLAACVKPLEFPPLGDPLPASAKLDIAPPIKDLTIRYSDSCGTTVDDGTSDTATPDYVIHVDLVDSSFDLNKEALYDRAPAVLHLNAIARIHDQKGTLLRQTDIKIARQERLRLEQLSKNCNYLIDPFIRDTVVDFATRVSLNARQAVTGQETASSAEPSPIPMGSVVGASSAPPTQALRFKAMLLDENSNLVLEGGEHVRVRVDIINAGTRVIESASASLTGTPVVIEQFPATTLPIPPLQPGETKSLEFIATLPPTKQAQQA